MLALDPHIFRLKYKIHPNQTINFVFLIVSFSPVHKNENWKRNPNYLLFNISDISDENVQKTCGCCSTNILFWYITNITANENITIYMTNKTATRFYNKIKNTLSSGVGTHNFCALFETFPIFFSLKDIILKISKINSGKLLGLIKA